MPELPEVESARAVIERNALGRRIVDVDDTDTYETRPHRPGDLKAALVGRRLTAANRRGKSMWVETSGIGRAKTAGPVLGIHLGMSGKIVIADGKGREIDGGDYWERGRQPGDHRFSRFSLTFADGGALILVDPRRLGRVRLDPPVERLGPDAARITLGELRAVLARSSAPLKARLMDQEQVAGIGNLLADQLLWAASLAPARPASSLSSDEVTALHKAIRKTVADAIKGGGVHTLSVVPFRRAEALCPRDGAPMRKSTVGGRTTWSCSREQVWTG